jgi:hypothetical protein
VLQGRFGSRLVEDGAYARAVLRYIALNPVSAGRVDRPECWPWSSYRFVAGQGDPPDFLSLEQVWAAFGTADPATGRARFAHFVSGGLQETLDDPLFHGSSRLAAQLAPELAPHQPTRDFIYPQRFAARPLLTDLVDGLTRASALEDAARAAFDDHGYTLTEIGTTVGREPSTVWRWVRRARARRASASGVRS